MTNFYCACSKKEKIAILLWNSNHLNLVKKTQVNCKRDLILARGHNNKLLVLPLFICKSFFQLCDPRLHLSHESLLAGAVRTLQVKDSALQVFVLWLEHTWLDKHLLRLTPKSCLQENMHQYVQWAVWHLVIMESHWDFPVYCKQIFYYFSLLKRIYCLASVQVLGLNGHLNLR